MARAIDSEIRKNVKAMFKFQLRIGFLFFLLVLSIRIDAQTTFLIKKYVCPSESTSTFIYDSRKAGKSDGYCSSGTQLTMNVSGPTSLGTVTLTRLDGGPHRVQVNVTWNPGQMGVLKVDVYFRRRLYDGFPSFGCHWTGWDYLYTYELRREHVSPSGAITGNFEATVPNDQTESTFNLAYSPANTFPKELAATKVRYQNGRLVNGNPELIETPI
ncbi:MAG: hypothetical protein ACKOE6_10530, partial [Flammeovirgaceae bacterium]